MFRALFGNRKQQLRIAGISVALGASLVFAWLTVHAPERGRNAAAALMESQSARFFASERDIGTLARDAQSGVAASIGLSAQYALVALEGGERYYVRIDTQRALVTELLKDRLASGAPAVFSLDDVQPPAGPLASLGQHFTPGMASLLGPLLIILLLVMMNPVRGAGAMFKSVARPVTRFADVIGVHEAKEALEDIVAYLKNPQRFADLGARPPKGVVLEGHFGAGKTLLARAVAGEAGVPFFSLSGSDFSEMFMGVGVRRVKKLFAAARAQAPCVIFIDEIDGLGHRSTGSSAGETENNRIINAILVELDGFSASTGIVVLGATNNVDNLDPALIRPGRFDRTCHLGLPDVDERAALFALYASALTTAGDGDFRQLARLSSGLSPAAIANVVNRAALLAAKESAVAVTQMHFQQVLEQHRMGGAANPGQAPLSAQERRRIAVHEAGHAIVARLLGTGVVEKVSIVKRGRALGVTVVTNEEDRILQSETEVRSRISMLLGGRCAELLVLDSLSTGAANDLEHVSSLAWRMVTELGFGREIGPFSYAGLPQGERQGSAYPEAIAEARALVKGIESQCAALLAAHRPGLERLTAQLLEHDTVDGAVVDACLAECVVA
jgi:cell division protease FtsH